MAYFITVMVITSVLSLTILTKFWNDVSIEDFYRESLAKYIFVVAISLSAIVLALILYMAGLVRRPYGHFVSREVSDLVHWLVLSGHAVQIGQVISGLVTGSLIGYWVFMLKFVGRENIYPVARHNRLGYSILFFAVASFVGLSPRGYWGGLLSGVSELELGAARLAFYRPREETPPRGRPVHATSKASDPQGEDILAGAVAVKLLLGAHIRMATRDTLKKYAHRDMEESQLREEAKEATADGLRASIFSTKYDRDLAEMNTLVRTLQQCLNTKNYFGEDRPYNKVFLIGLGDYLIDVHQFLLDMDSAEEDQERPKPDEKLKGQMRALLRHTFENFTAIAEVPRFSESLKLQCEPFLRKVINIEDQLSGQLNQESWNDLIELAVQRQDSDLISDDLDAFVERFWGKLVGYSQRLESGSSDKYYASEFAALVTLMGRGEKAALSVLEEWLSQNSDSAQWIGDIDQVLNRIYARGVSLSILGISDVQDRLKMVSMSEGNFTDFESLLNGRIDELMDPYMLDGAIDSESCPGGIVYKFWVLQLLSSINNYVFGVSSSPGLWSIPSSRNFSQTYQMRAEDLSKFLVNLNYGCFVDARAHYYGVDKDSIAESFFDTAIAINVQLFDLSEMKDDIDKDSWRKKLENLKARATVPLGRISDNIRKEIATLLSAPFSKNRNLLTDAAMLANLQRLEAIQNGLDEVDRRLHFLK